MSAADPAPRQEPAWHARFATQLAASQAIAEFGGSVGIAFLGDSITEGWTWTGDTWATEWKRRRALNLGIGGDQTAHLLYRLRHGLLDGLSIPAVVQLIGINNTWNGGDAADIARGIGACLAEIRRTQPRARLLCLSVLPTTGGAAYTNPLVDAINAQLPAIAAAHGADQRNIGDRFRGADGVVPQELMPDGVHLSPAGYGIMTRAVVEWLG